MMVVAPDLEAFRALCESGEGNLVPVSCSLAADYETPVSAYEKLAAGGGGSFLFESAEMTQASGRYSLLGARPRLRFTAYGKRVVIEEAGERREYEAEGDPLVELERLMAGYRPVAMAGLPPFVGGAVGFLGYDMVRFFEPGLGAGPADDRGLPDMAFFLADSVLVFDHRFRKIQVICQVRVDEHASVEAAYAEGCARLEEVVGRLEQPLAARPMRAFPEVGVGEVEGAGSNTSREDYEGMVRRAVEYIGAGDVFQVVPSQRFEMAYEGRPLDLYRSLRHVNPSPYMFCVEFPEGFSLVGSSPEVHVKCMGGRIEIRPIAGTRWRGATEEEDDALAAELLGDEKERAEHIMLVDLARNDVGRVAEFGSVVVDDLMIVERYSHVMHIVSNVSGRLAAGRTAYDVMRSTFPAGTVSGAPKVRAMEIIDELEKVRRGPYAGAVGYFGFDGKLDSCIALRTCVLAGGKAYVQAGAGVVADSVPGYEYQETCNKALGMLRAVARAAELGG
jgi:anthranilate synthase component I